MRYIELGRLVKPLLGIGCRIRYIYQPLIFTPNPWYIVVAQVEENAKAISTIVQ